jgi:Holliday junction DNA helicase RuvA
MISALTGTLTRVDDQAAHLTCGPLVYEILVPAADVEALRAAVNTEITFHTIFYLEGSAGGGNLDPKLLGFLRPEDKQFFHLFTTVKGIGPKTALRALSVSVGEIAEAIESRDTRALVKLDGIGKRTAELIVAELAGKVSRFAGVAPARPGPSIRRSGDEEDALAGMTGLGEKRMDAERLLERVKATQPGLAKAEELIREMLKMRMAR